MTEKIEIPYELGERFISMYRLKYNGVCKGGLVVGIRWIILIGVCALALSGCASAPSGGGNEPMETLSPPNQEHFPTQPQEDAPENTPTPFPPNLQNVIAVATDDLAKRLSVSSSQIDLIGAIGVIWPDTSLGCPQPGASHNQVLTEGFLIRLEADNRIYQYHTDASGQVVFCENPQFPRIPVTPGDIQDGIPWVPVD